jgi:hypothetical protein
MPGRSCPSCAATDSAMPRLADATFLLLLDPRLALFMCLICSMRMTAA